MKILSIFNLNFALKKLCKWLQILLEPLTKLLLQNTARHEPEKVKTQLEHVKSPPSYVKLAEFFIFGIFENFWKAQITLALKFGKIQSNWG